MDTFSISLMEQSFSENENGGKRIEAISFFRIALDPERLAIMSDLSK